MAQRISRRDFIKWTGIGAAATVVLTGCGPAARYVTRRPYAEMPEYNQTGTSTYFATTCRECPAGCGIIVRTKEGRAIKIEGNPNHPVNRGKICSRGLTAVQGLYNPDRVQKPRKNAKRGEPAFENMDWQAAVTVVQQAFQSGQSAFLLGVGADHLYDFVTELTTAAGMPAPVRYSTSALMDGLPDLLDVSKLAYGKRVFPYFDIANADLIFSFGADWLNSWLSPVAYNRAYSRMRNGPNGRRGTLVSFEPHQSLTSANADFWLAVTPGSQGLAARAIGNLVAQAKGGAMPTAFADIDLASAAKSTGISEDDFHRLADMFASASQPLVIPGGNDPAGIAAALELNRLVGNLGQPGGVFLQEAESSLSPAADIRDLIARMSNGEIKSLFIHGVNPLFDLPAGWGFAAALAKVPQVISFSSFEDETARSSDYILPDHSNLESWGYQSNSAGADRQTWSGLQPVVSRLYDTHATMDVLLAAASGLGASVTSKLPYKDEVEFIQSRLSPLLKETGFYSALDIPSFWAQWLQYGGWWQTEANLPVPPKTIAESSLPPSATPDSLGENQLRLIVTPGGFGDGSGANRPWLQETPHPLTTGTWGSWVEIHPATAAKLGIKDDDIVKVESAAGAVEAPAYLFPAIRPDCVAIPFGQGHTALGRYAAGRGCNPAALLGAGQDAAAQAAFEGLAVKLTNTGRTKTLARLEDREGVYGEKPAR
jgi:anaerobic selenocysteine-containing dehydrogenase